MTKIILILCYNAALPPLTLFFEFSAAGLQSGMANARGFAFAFLDWSRLWYGLLLSLTGFGAFKLYGRYSLPKPFRPRVRVVRGTLRLVFLTSALFSVVTFLAYFGTAFSDLYANPAVRVVIDVLRKSLGL